MTQEDVIVLWKDANGWDVRGYKNTLEDLERFANLVAAKEREACAKVCDELPAPNIYSDSDKGMWDITSLACGDAIRARGEQA